jgi:hypothetical protein
LGGIVNDWFANAEVVSGILMQEKTVSLLKEAGYVDDNEAKAPGGQIDLDVLFPKALLGRATPSKGKTADVVRVPTNGSVGSELPVKRKRGRPRLYPLSEPSNAK